MYTYTLPQTITDRNKIQVGATNLLIELLVKDGYTPLNISTATVKTILIEKPDDTIISASAGFYTDGTDGLLTYFTQTGDLDQAGIYNVQAYIEMPDFQGYTTPINFTVYANLPLDNN